MLFVICCVIELLLCILSAFIPTLYTKDWWSYRIKNVSSAYTSGGVHQFTMLDMYGWIYFVVMGIVAVTSIVYIIAFLTKHQNIIPQFVIGIVFLLPIALIIASTSELKQESYTVGNKYASISAGTSSGLTGFGVALCVLCILNLLFAFSALIAYKKIADDKADKSIEVINVKESKKKKAEKIEDIDDWKL